MARLIILSGGEAKTHDLTAAESVLGRHPECEIVLDSNMVSRKHAKVIRDGTLFYLEDLGSGNGTTLNGEKIVEKTLLKHEDRIKFGPILMRFEDQSAVPTGRMPVTPPPRRPVPVAQAPAASAHQNTFVGDFHFDLTPAEEDSSLITGSQSGLTPYGSIQVRPEAKLEAVLEITRSLAGTVDLQKILPKVLDSLFTIFPQADRGCVLLKEEGQANLVPRAMKHRREGEDSTIKLSRTILNKVMTEKTAILSADAANDSRFNASESISNLTIRSMMCVPMLALNGDLIGVINVDTQNAFKQFQNEDLDLLLAVASQAAVTYENARLLTSFLEKQKQDNEMKIARDVQHALLPEGFPEVAGYEFFASYEAAQAVGGDYYGCHMSSDGKTICLAFGDVAGKGVPAALVMSRLSSVVQIILDFVNDVGEATERINNHMCVNAVEGRFVTFTLVFLDTTTHEFTLAIAGHMSPMIRRSNGTVEELPDDLIGMPLGVVEGMPYSIAKVKLEPGDTVVIYTDGVSEAMNPASDLYGLEHLRDFITKGTSNPSQLGRAILKDVKRHANGRYQNDDITLMSFGRVE